MAEQPKTTEIENTLTGILKINDEILARYKEIERYFASKPVSPFADKHFTASIVAYLALINNRYVLYKSLPSNENVETIDPSVKREELLKQHGFAISENDVKKPKLDAALAASPMVMHAIEQGANLAGMGEE